MAGKYQAYREYKDSGVEWLREVPVAWVVIPVKRISKIFNGATPKSGVRDYWDGDIPWVTPADLGKTNTPYINEGARSITSSGYESCGTSLVPKGTVVLSSRAPIGTLGIAAKSLCTNQGCKSLVIEKQFSNKFLYYVLLSSTEQLNLLGRGTTFLELSSDALGSYKIGLPSKSVQDQIANFLDHETAKIDTLIDKQQQLIKLLKEKRQAVISHAVTKGLNPNAPMRDSGVEWLGEVPEHWSEKRLGYLAKQERAAFVDGPFGSDLKSSDYIESGIPLIQLNNIRDNTHIIRNMKFITEDKKQQLRRHLAIPGDIVIAKMADPVARAAAVVNDYPEYIIVADCVKLSPNRNLVNLEYLVWAINCDYVRINAELVSTGTTRIRISLGELKKLKVPFPPYDEQLRIAEFLNKKKEKFEIIELKAEKQVSLLRERRTALISAAVTGKIDVRNWVAPEPSNNKNKEVGA